MPAAAAAGAASCLTEVARRLGWVPGWVRGLAPRAQPGAKGSRGRALLFYYSITLLLYYSATLLRFYFTTVLLYYSTAILLFYCTTVLLYYLTTFLLYYSTSTTILLYYSTADLLLVLRLQRAQLLAESPQLRVGGVRGGGCARRTLLRAAE